MTKSKYVNVNWCVFCFYLFLFLHAECPTVSLGSISTTSAGTVVIDVSDSTPTTNIPITTTETNSTLPVNNDGAYTGEVIKTMGKICNTARR